MLKRGLLLFFVLLIPFVSAVSVEKVEIQNKEVVITIQGKVSSQIEFFKEGLSKGTYKLCEENTCDFAARRELRIRLSNTGINEIGDYVLRIQEIDSDGQASVQSHNLKINKENLDICSDGTLNNACSANKPLFCDNGKLAEKCGKGTFTYYTNNLELGITTRHETARCGDCPTGKTCQADGSCKIIPQAVSKQKAVSDKTGLSGAGEGCVSEQGVLFDNPSSCSNYNNPQQCNACGLCIWGSKHCCPKGMKWDSSKSVCSAEVKSTQPNCADYDFNKDGDVGFGDSSALSEQKIDYNKDGKYSWMDKILFLWDINLVGKGGCVWSDEDLLKIALAGDSGKCDSIQDVKLKNACNHITITSAMLAGEISVEDSLKECNDKFGDTERQNCIDRINVFSGQCGNNVISEGEECDGTNIGIASCVDIGKEGQVSCNLCKLDYSSCSPKRCSDAVVKTYVVAEQTLSDGSKMVACGIDYSVEALKTYDQVKNGLCGEGYSECRLSDYVDLYVLGRLPLTYGGKRGIETFRFEKGKYQTSPVNKILGDYIGNTHVNFNYADSYSGSDTEYWMGSASSRYGTTMYYVNGVLCCT